MLPLRVSWRPQFKKWAIVGGRSSSYNMTISGLSMPENIQLWEPEEFFRVHGAPEFNSWQLKDLDFLQWEDWNQIMLFNAIPEVVTYVINPMIKLGTHQNIWNKQVKV